MHQLLSFYRTVYKTAELLPYIFNGLILAYHLTGLSLFQSLLRTNPCILYNFVKDQMALHTGIEPIFLDLAYPYNFRCLIYSISLWSGVHYNHALKVFRWNLYTLYTFENCFSLARDYHFKGLTELGFLLTKSFPI